MLNKIYFLNFIRYPVLTALIILSNFAFASDPVAFCNNCNGEIAKEKALAKVYRGRVHIIDLEMNRVYSFHVTRSNEPGFTFHEANRIPSPQDLLDLVSEISLVILHSTQNGASFDRSKNILNDTVYINLPGVVSSRDLYTYENSQAVSNHLRMIKLPNFYYIFKAAWQSVIREFIIVVQVKFSDGSSAVYRLGPILFSDHPYVLVDGSIVNPIGKPIDRNGLVLANPSGDARKEGFIDNRVNQGGQFLTQRCELWSFPNGNGGRYFLERNCVYGYFGPI